MFTERLSDLLTVESGRAVTLTQIKKTATRKTVRSALEELWLIHQLAARKTPRLADKLRYRVLASHGTESEIKAALSDWHPERSPDPGDLSLFLQKVSPAIEPDPEDELLALLANKLDCGNPLDLVYRWLGLLQDATAEGGLFEATAKFIWSDLHQLRGSDSESRPPGIYIWETGDQPPPEVSHGGFLSGSQPQVRHLSEGFFAPRPEVYAALTDHAEAWIDSDPAGQDQGLRVPVFWIDGRSGSGKSVALLHLLARLHERGRGPILWIADKVEALPRTLRWARRLQRKGRPVIIGLDDPFAPAEQMEAAALWREALTVIQDAREGNRSDEVPLLFCCGPSEQAEALQAEMSRDVLLETHTLPVEEEEELQVSASGIGNVPDRNLRTSAVITCCSSNSFSNGESLEPCPTSRPTFADGCAERTRAEPSTIS